MSLREAILISVDSIEQRKSSLVLLQSIDDALGKMGYRERSDVGVLIEGWPVKFLPSHRRSIRKR